MKRLLAVTAILFASCAATHSPQPRADWTAVDAALGRSGSAQPGNVHKYGFPRGDLDVRIDEVRLKPALALGSWAAFLDTGSGHAMAMGDLVLTEDEVNDVISALQAGGIEQSALHTITFSASRRV